MTGVKIDEEKIKACIAAIKETQKRNPYVICNEQTKELFEACRESDSLYISNSHLVFSPAVQAGIEPVQRYRGCKILIDEDLPFGEVIVG